MELKIDEHGQEMPQSHTEIKSRNHEEETHMLTATGHQ